MDHNDPLGTAAHRALLAPSIFNTQPWRWTIRSGRLELWADRTRQLDTVDPDGRLLTLSCGVACHHAQSALGAATVNRLLRPDLIAVLSQAPGAVPDPKLLAAIRSRHTDRRAYTRQPVTPADLNTIADACRHQGAAIHIVSPQQVPTMALAAVRAGALQLSDSRYRAELMDWTHRPPWSGDGVPTESTVDITPRRVPVRDFTPFGGHTTPAGPETDLGASYAVIFTRDDTALSWLRAGEALSAALLTATMLGLATATISEVTEVPAARDELHHIISPHNGHPQVAIRIGHPTPGEPPPKATRRPPQEVITHSPPIPGRHTGAA